MCGIFGCAGGQRERADVERAVTRLAHRGPDDWGIQRMGPVDGRSVDPDVWLGFRRLSILDLSPRGHQPMSDASGRYWLVFNGEIYNYRELRRELEGRGHRFASETDSEVILYAYREWGVGALDRFVGMFAFGLWDGDRQELVLARDRLGIKPLYYHHVPGRIAFGSELKALLALPDVERRLDPAATAAFFDFLWVPDPDTLLAGIRKLEPGTYGVYKEGALEVRRYWDVPLPQAASTGRAVHGGPAGPGAGAEGEAEAVERLDALLHEAVGARLVSDVPLGAFLSGGVDSSLIVALMRRAGLTGITTQTVYWPESAARYDLEVSDRDYARTVRDHFADLDYHEIEIQPDVISMLPRLIWHLDDPVADPAALSTYLICRAAKQHATVMLAGMGAEELFGGYGRHRAALLAERYRRAPRVLRRGFIEPAVEALPAARPGPFMATVRNAKKFVRSAGLDFEDRYLGYRTYYSPDDLGAMVRSGASGVLDRHRSILASSAGLDPLTRMIHLDLKTFLPNLNLAYTDLASMAASVEVRVPLLDHRVVEYVMGLPAGLKIRGRTQKYVLKRVADRYLPRDVVYRRKTGFAGPVRGWVQNELRPMIHDLLSRDRLQRRGVLDPTAVWRVIEDGWSGREDNALRIWAFLTFELWAETYLDRDGEVAVAA
jgi:asparagine synthase (glutamine-hydrolysing)